MLASYYRPCSNNHFNRDLLLLLSLLLLLLLLFNLRKLSITIHFLNYLLNHLIEAWNLLQIGVEDHQRISLHAEHWNSTNIASCLGMNQPSKDLLNLNLHFFSLASRAFHRLDDDDDDDDDPEDSRVMMMMMMMMMMMTTTTMMMMMMTTTTTMMMMMIEGLIIIMT